MRKLTWRKDGHTNKHYLEAGILAYAFVYPREADWVAAVPIARAVKTFEDLRAAKIWAEKLARRKYVEHQ